MSKTRDNIFDPSKITAFRGLKGWTRTKLGAEAGLTESAITLIEQGKRQSPDSIRKIARALRIPMRRLMTDEAAAKTA